MHLIANFLFRQDLRNIFSYAKFCESFFQMAGVCMKIIPAEDIKALLDWPALVNALREMFATGGCEAPPRHHHTIPVPNSPDATLLLMPAWQSGNYIGVKLVTVFPGNAALGQPAIAGMYLLLDGAKGHVLAMLDGGELTARRTAAASALAAQYLAPENASTMLMIGTGRLSTNLIRAHASVRPIEEVLVFGRSVEKAETIAANIRQSGLKAEPVTDLQKAAESADIISCATLSTVPILHGDWITQGTHVDLVGAFKSTMRETDDEVMAKADLIFVDTRAGAFGEAGDLIQAISSGAISKDPIAGDLLDLTSGKLAGRLHETDRTVFKSVGASLEDLAAAILVYERSLES